MGRIFGILFIVVAIWVGVEVYTQGTGGAFGGLFVELGLASEEEAVEAPVTDRAARAWSDAYRRAEERVDGQLE